MLLKRIFKAFGEFKTQKFPQAPTQLVPTSHISNEEKRKRHGTRVFLFKSFEKKAKLTRIYNGKQRLGSRALLKSHLSLVTHRYYINFFPKPLLPLEKSWLNA